MDEHRYRIGFTKAAQRQLAALATDVQRRISRAIDRLVRDPRPPGVEKLAGSTESPRWRIRVGDYRVVYEVHNDRVLVLVIRIGHRSTVYRTR